MALSTYVSLMKADLLTLAKLDLATTRSIMPINSDTYSLMAQIYTHVYGQTMDKEYLLNLFHALGRILCENNTFEGPADAVLKNMYFNTLGL